MDQAGHRAATLLGALRLQAEHIESLFAHATSPAVRRALAAVLTDAHTLAGWQSLDRGEIGTAWDHYRRACDAARAAESPALLAHALAEQAVVLAGIGRPTDAAAMSGHAREIGQGGPPLLRAWLAAAHGEALAADARRTASLQAFDDAVQRLPANAERDEDGPYLALDAVHLAHWRGHALAASATSMPSPSSRRRCPRTTRTSAAQRRDFELISPSRIWRPGNETLRAKTLP